MTRTFVLDLNPGDRVYVGGARFVRIGHVVPLPNGEVRVTYVGADGHTWSTDWPETETFTVYPLPVDDATCNCTNPYCQV